MHPIVVRIVSTWLYAPTGIVAVSSASGTVSTSPGATILSLLVAPLVSNPAGAATQACSKF